MVIKLSKSLERQADRANALIEYFEQKGRHICGVRIDNNVVHLDFRDNDAPNSKHHDLADLVRMDD